MDIRYELGLTSDGVLTVAGHGQFHLFFDRAPEHRNEVLGAANRKLADLGLQLDYAWFGNERPNQAWFGHAVPAGAYSGVWD